MDVPFSLGQYESDARKLAQAWSFAAWSASSRAPAVEAWLSASEARGDPRLGWLSRGFATIALARGPWLPDCVDRVRTELFELRATGWTRAIRLAEVAWASCLSRDASTQREAIDLLRSHGDAVNDARPPVERIWTDLSLCTLLTNGGQFDDALRAGVTAERLASRSGIAVLDALAARSLSFVFLTLGDLEGALEVLPREIAMCRSHGAQKIGSYYNLLLALLLCDRLDDASTLIEQTPWLYCDAVLREAPSLCCLQACIHAESGRNDRASVMLQSMVSPPLGDELQLAANRAWLIARTMIALGQAQGARDELERQLRFFNRPGHVLSPMNGAEIHQAHSVACESLGDFGLAMTSLRASQNYRAQWIKQSMHSRVQTMRLKAAAAQRELGAEPLPEAGAGAELPAAEPHAASGVPALPALAPGQESGPKSEKGGASAPSGALPSPRATEAKVLGTAAANALAAAPGRANVLAGSVATLSDDSRLVAYVAHELRNPVGGMLGLTSMLMSTDLDERQRNWVELTQSSAQLLLQLCNDLLDKAKLEAGKFSLQPAPTDVTLLLGQTLALLRPMADLKRLSLRSRIANPIPQVLIDGRRLTQIVLNLLNNAIKFTQVGGIELDVNWVAFGDGTHGELRIAVRDSGPGLDVTQSKRLFAEFVQLPNNHPAAGSGSGLGLALCRSLVQLMGGRIGVDSNPGQGSSFWFVLPLTVAATAAGASPQDATRAA